MRYSSLCFYPKVPFDGFVLIKALKMLDIPALPVEEALTDSRRIVWVGDTIFRSLPFTEDDKEILNFSCRDISKEHVGRCFQAVFGYALAIKAPHDFNGMMVEKSDANATHDGRLVQGPVSAKAGMVYQIHVDTTNSDGMVQDIRVPIIGNSIPFVYLKYRPKETMFSNANSRVEIARTADALRPHEVSNLLLLARMIGLDIGEMDVLRDKRSGLVFVVDANRTPLGPPNKTTASDARYAVGAIGCCFAEEFLYAQYHRNASIA